MLQMIRAIYHDGKIQPLDAIPGDWHEGDELVINAAPSADVPLEPFEEWVADLREAVADISDEDHARMELALTEIEARSKEQARRDIERSNIDVYDPQTSKPAKRAS
jgi:hypothetical protein